MVDPSRIKRRIGECKITDDGTADERGLIFISFYVNGRERWYLSYSIADRKFTLFAGEDDRRAGYRISRQHGALCRYLTSIMPPDIVAICTAASLGVAD